MSRDPETLIARIRTRAQAFVADNLRHPTDSDLLYTMTAMQIGASIATEMEMEAIRKEIESIAEQSART